MKALNYDIQGCVPRPGIELVCHNWDPAQSNKQNIKKKKNIPTQQAGTCFLLSFWQTRLEAVGTCPNSSWKHLSVRAKWRGELRGASPAQGGPFTGSYWTSLLQQRVLLRACDGPGLAEGGRDRSHPSPPGTHHPGAEMRIILESLFG